MGVEAIGPAVASVAPAVGRVASSVGGALTEAPSIGALSGIGSSIINEGPVAPTFLEFNPVGEIIFNPFKGKEATPAPSVIGQAEEVAAAAWEATEPVDGMVNKVTDTFRTIPIEWTSPRIIFPTPAPEFGVVADVLQAHRTKTALEVVGMVDLSQKVVSYLKPEIRTVYQRASAVAIPSPQEKLIEEIVEEKKVVTEDQEKDDPKIKKEEKQSVLKIKIVEAVKVTQLRRSAVYEAARKVKKEAEKMGEKVFITGKKLSRFLSGEFWKYISPLVGEEGYDGTIPLTLRAIENNQTEYTSLEQAQTELSKPVTEHIPLQQGEGGRIATLEEVREVLEGKEKEILRANTPAEIVIKRVVKKDETVASTGQAVSAVVEEKEEESGKPTLRDLGLEELFQKAA